MDAERYQGHPNGRPSLDERVERIAQELGEAIDHEDDPERRAELRDYAAELVREETAGPDASRPAARPMGPLAVAVLLFLVGCVLLLVATPIGIVFLLLAGVAGAWGVIAARRASVP